MKIFDLQKQELRTLNQWLHQIANDGETVRVIHPRGAHAVACGIDREVEVIVDGHVGYYCAGMHQKGRVTVNGNAGVGVAENMMSGRVRIAGNASQSAGATAHGGLLVIEGDAAARCGISLKGGDIVVKGNVGHMSAFMSQAGRLVVCGDAGDALGDSLYETRIYVRGDVKSLGSGCVEHPLLAEDLAELSGLLAAAEMDFEPAEFRRFGTDRTLYNFHVDDATL